MNGTAQIFLSYAREDEEKVGQLYQKLSDAGFKPWMDIKDILPGERWESCIRRAIRHSDFFLACLSVNSVSKRGFLQKEIKDALDIWQEKLEEDIYLIPARLEDCEVPESLGGFQWVDLFEADGWTRLVRAIQVGMKRRTQVVKPGVQESIVFEPYLAHEKPSLGTGMAAPEKGPEEVREQEDLQSFLTSGTFEPVSLDLEGFHSMYPEATSKKLVPYRNLTTEGFLNYRRELPRGHYWLKMVPFDIFVDPEDNGDHGVVGILLEPTSENEEQSFTNRARVEKVKSVFILLTANNGLTTWKGCKIGEILLHFEDDLSPQSLSLHLGREIRDWWPWNKRLVGREPGPIDQCTSPTVTEVWHSSDRQVVLDMLRIDVDGEPKKLESITFKARLESVDWNKHLPDLPGLQILGTTCWVAP